MDVGVIGAGYVGLVTAVGLAAQGHRVRVGEADAERVAALQAGNVPFYEPGLAEVLNTVRGRGLVTFHASNRAPAEESAVVVLAVPTPPNGDGSADTSIVEAVSGEIAQYLRPDAVVVLKSTVPPGTTTRVEDVLRRYASTAAVVANPEFLREGSALEDFFAPSRIVLGSHDDAAIKVMLRLYSAFDVPVVTTDPVSAELIKYASNSYLATRISFANEMAALAEATGADIRAVMDGVGHDPRIGHDYLNPGPGFGGSCLPKDTRGLLATGARYGCDLPLVQAAVDVNSRQLAATVDKIRRAVGGDLRGKTVAVWGLAFKAGSDDVRESPAVALAEAVLAEGAEVVAHDPLAAPVNHGIRRVAAAIEAVKEADVLLVATKWPEFREVELGDVWHAMRGDAIVDARNWLDARLAAACGFAYYGIGGRIA